MILWFDMSQVDTKSTSKRGLLYMLLFIAMLIGVVYFQEFRRKKSLKDFSTTSAVITYKSPGGYKSSYQIHVKYKINGKSYESDGVGGIKNNNCIDKFRVGDTVLIKYSLKDPKIVSIIDCEEGS